MAPAPHLRMQLIRSRIPLALAASLSLSCASYNARTDEALRAFSRGEFERALVAYGAEEVANSAFLNGAEAGMVALSAGDWDAALDHLGRASAEVEDVENEALISTANAGELLLSWAINESFTKYDGEGYERVMLHAGLAMAYLASGSIDSVQVEVRRANALLENQEELYETAYGAGGLGHLLSALAYELRGDLDDAYIDYKRLANKELGGALVGRSLVKLARVLNFESDLRMWEDEYGPQEVPPDGAASVVVLAGVGLGPYKQETTIAIPTNDGILQWSVPGYVRRPQAIEGLEIDVDGRPTVRSVVVENVAEVAKKNLDDRLAWLAAKSAVRAVLKRELTKELTGDHDVLGRIVGDLFTLVTERADLRAWQTLPDTWQAARVDLAPGEHELVLHGIGGESVRLGRFLLDPEEKLFVFVRTLGRRVFAYPVGGQRLDPEPLTPALEPAEPDLAPQP